MGKNYSKSNNEDIKEKAKFLKKFKNKKDYNCETEDISLNLQTKENTDNSSMMTTTTEILDKSKLKPDLVPYTFYWKGNCDNVNIAGSFLDNWKKPIPMDKNEKTGIFEKTFLLPRTKHQFKFIIGKDWACSDLYPTVPNEYNSMNNFIDLTNYIISEIKKDEDKKNEIKERNNNKIIIEEMNKNLLKKQKKTYNCKFPLINELNTTAPCIIHHYRPKFNINYQSNQALLRNFGKKINLNYKEQNFNTENNTFKKIMVWPHEKLMHVCPNIEDLSETNENYNRLCITQRNKHKYLTIVYYRPK